MKKLVWFEIAGLSLVGLSIFSKFSSGSFNPLVMLSHAPKPTALPAAAPATANVAVEVGDIVTIPLASMAEGSASNPNLPEPDLTPREQAMAMVMMLSRESGGTIKMLVTKVGGMSSGDPPAVAVFEGNPVLIPKAASTFPVTAVRQVERGGRVLSKTPGTPEPVVPLLSTMPIEVINTIKKGDIVTVNPALTTPMFDPAEIGPSAMIELQRQAAAQEPQRLRVINVNTFPGEPPESRNSWEGMSLTRGAVVLAFAAGSVLKIES